MGAIFLSYAREDRGFAEKLAHVLEAAGHDVWWDRNLDGGEEFSAGIEAALDEAELVVVAWSKHSVKSRWVRDEAAVGVEKSRLVAITIDGTRPPMGFRQFHTLDLAGWKNEKRDSRAAELLRSVERRLAGKAQAAPSGVQNQSPLPQRRLWVLAAALALAIAAALATYLINKESPRRPASKPTIALLPFTAVSPDADLREIASQSRESISHTLSETGIPVRLVDSKTAGQSSAGDFMLSGEVSRAADKVAITVHMDEAAHGVTILTQKFEATGGDIRNLPERIGAQVAGLFDASTLMLLDRRHPLDPALMAELLAASSDDLGHYQVVKRVAAKAPNEPNALIGIAFYTGFVLGELPRDQRAQAVREARQAADKALKLAPEFGDTYITWCLLRSETLWADCENRIRTGNRIDPDAPYLKSFYALLLRRVGRFDDAVGLMRLSYTHDPYNPFKIRDMLRTLELSGDSDGARKLYEQGLRWYPDYKLEFASNRLVGLISRGDVDAIGRFEKDIGPEALYPEYRKSDTLTVNWKSPAAVGQACQRAPGMIVKARCMLTLANLGDQDASYAIADKLYPRRVGRTPGETERIWLDQPYVFVPEFVASPAAAGMRRDPRYLGLAQRTGLLDYWRSGRLPDFCRKQPEPICAQITRR